MPHRPCHPAIPTSRSPPHPTTTHHFSLATQPCIHPRNPAHVYSPLHTRPHLPSHHPPTQPLGTLHASPTHSLSSHPSPRSTAPLLTPLPPIRSRLSPPQPIQHHTAPRDLTRLQHTRHHRTPQHPTAPHSTPPLVPPPSPHPTDLSSTPLSLPDDDTLTAPSSPQRAPSPFTPPSAAPYYPHSLGSIDPPHTQPFSTHPSPRFTAIQPTPPQFTPPRFIPPYPCRHQMTTHHTTSLHPTRFHRT